MTKEYSTFELATKMRFRYPFRGEISTEDLWDLPLKDLDLIFKNLSKQLKASEDESLLDDKPAEDIILGAKIEIIRAIVADKKSLAAAAAHQRENRQKAARIREIIAAKQDASLVQKSEEELLALLGELV